jgi:ABC-2 type transport system permease protein
MSVTAIARKDFQDARGSRALWLLTGLFVLFAAFMVWAFAEFEAGGVGADPDLAALGFFDFLAASAALFVSITALVVAYKAVAGERDSGSAKLLLGLPHSRRDVVLGKTLGRGVTMAIPVLLGFAVAFAIAFALLGSVNVVDYALFVGVTVLFAFAYVSLMVAVSASVATTSRASALAFGVFVVLELVWNLVATGAVYVANGFALPASFAAYPEWYFGLVSFVPSSAYQSAVSAAVSGATTGAGLAGMDAVYLEPWFGFVWLALWATVPLALAYGKFTKADL